MTGSPEQIRAALTDLLPRLRRFARTLTLDDSTADDCVAAAIERALAEHDRPTADVETWLFGLVRAASLKQPPQIAGQTDSAAGSIEHALKQLPEEQRAAVALTLIEGLSYARAAQAMDVSVLRFMNRLARGREALQAVL